MRWGIVFFGLVGLYVLEGTVFQLFSFRGEGGGAVMLPRLVLVVLVLIALYAGRRRAFMLGLLFGLFMDIQYCDVIGVYAFSMAMIPYLSALAYQYFQLNVVLIILTVFLSVIVHETAVFYLYRLFNLADGVYHGLDYIPTALLNTFFAILIYRPLHKLLEYVQQGRQEEGNV